MLIEDHTKRRCIAKILQPATEYHAYSYPVFFYSYKFLE